jgi:hypothetical protein
MGGRRRWVAIGIGSPERAFFVQLAFCIRRLAFRIGLLATITSGAGWAQVNACDLVAPFGTIDAADVQAAINMTVGISPCTANIGGVSGVCNAAVVQRVVNAALGGACVTGFGTVAHYVSLSWTASTSAVAGYNIYRATASGGPYTKINTSLVVGTSYTDSTVSANVTYYYVARAVDNTGTESVNSGQSPAAAVPIP